MTQEIVQLSSTISLFQTIYLLGALGAGYATNYLCHMLGVYYGKKGVKYYSEVHIKKQNIIVHVIGMPFTIYGMTLWLPALAEYALEYDPLLTRLCLYLYYNGLYSYISLDDCVYFNFMYFPAVLLSTFYYVGGLYDIIWGLSISTIALVFQEVVGHNMSGDPPSRPEAVLNAILYAMYFSAHSFKRILRGKLLLYKNE